MVVADADPPRKRSRLSLKSRKGDNSSPSDDTGPPSLESAGTVPQGPVVQSEQELNDCSPPVIDDLTESDLPCEGPRVPPVASMENLGNTCFFNSVLEVLRYTPCFLEGLEELYRHIVYLEKVKASDVVQESEEVKTDPSLAWDLVKNMFKMYKHMEKREEMFSQFANADVTSMAVKPDKLLDVIREFNPMFEGNMQHDAQELLRCLLCYLEDSERELHSDYASILALDPALLKTPGAASAAPDPEKQSGNPIMEKFLLAGKMKSRKGKSAIMALKFDQPSEDAPKPLLVPEKASAGSKVDSESVRSKRSKPDSDTTDLPGSAEDKTKTDSSLSSKPQPKRRRIRHTKTKTVTDTDNCDEVDGSHSKLDPVCSETKEENEGNVKPAGRNTRRSSRRTAVNGKRGVSPVGPLAGKNSANSQIQTKLSHVETEKDSKTKQSILEELEKSPLENHVINGNHTENPSGVDKSQPTILSMFSKTGRQCRRLGMRGRVVHRDQDAACLSSQQRSLDVPEISPELRRSPRKCNGVRPASMTASPRKQDGFMTSPTSPARPDEFPAHAVSGNSGTVLDSTIQKLDPKSLRSSPVGAQVWDTNGVESPKKCFPVKDWNGDIEHSETGSVCSKPELLPDELLDLVPADAIMKTSPVSVKTENISPVKLTNSSSSSPLSPAKAVRMPSPMPSSGQTLPALCQARQRAKTVSPQPSQLMIKLQKCDHLCNTPTISASAAMKALKGPANPRGKVIFNRDMDDSDNNEQDSDEDEVSLGTKSSFKSVPLKSVCVKVEKCDMVCSSPEKSVSARFATTCLARQRAQRFNMIEKLFQGTMMMRTKCLECERCTERKESFQDVSVPLSAESTADSDSDTDEEKDSSLLRLMRAFTDVEHLRDDNKYYCDQCFRYVEAERSLHYEALPNILTVHLKRFSATSMFGCLSKINDHVTVPLLLSCLRYKCPKPCTRRDHRYTLYAIITHAGSTISSGHYLSYIKVRPNAVGCDTLSTYLNDSPDKKCPVFPDSEETPEKQPPKKLPPQHQNTTTSDSALGEMSPGGDASQRRVARNIFEDGDVDEAQEGSSKVSGQKRVREPVSSHGDRAGQLDKDRNSDPSDYHWLECDDETIRILSEKEFHGRLLEKEGALRGTPYVLFYHRLDTWRPK